MQNPAPSTMGVAAAAPPRRTPRPWRSRGVSPRRARRCRDHRVPHFREHLRRPSRTFQIPPPAQSAHPERRVCRRTGGMIAFEAPVPDGRRFCGVQPLDSLEPRPLAARVRGRRSILVAGQRHLGFGTSGVPRRLKRWTCRAARRNARRLRRFLSRSTWNAAGEIPYGEAGTDVRVRAAGGSPVKVTTLDPQRQEVQLRTRIRLTGAASCTTARRVGREHNGIFLDRWT